MPSSTNGLTGNAISECYFWPNPKQMSASSKIAIWSPDPDELDAAGVEANWDITSDSLAAWLAKQVNADQLLLVKSSQLEEDLSLPELQDKGIIDAAFVQTIVNATFKIRVINKDRFLSLHDQIN